MKTKRLILLAVMLLALALPLVAAASVTVTWNWSPSVAGVNYFRYQVGGEAEDGWTVVSSDVTSYSLTDVDGSVEYTLYLQQSYDGRFWSPSATETSYRVVPTPVNVEGKVVAESELVVETEPEEVVEEIVAVEEPAAEEPAIEESAEEAVAPVLAASALIQTAAGDVVITSKASEATIAYPAGYDAYAADFVAYVNATYPDIASYVTITPAEGSLAVSYPELASQEYLDYYTAAVADEISAYIERTVAAELSAAAAEEVVIETPSLSSVRTLATAAGDVVITATESEAVISYPAAFDVYAVPFISYLEANYPEITPYISASNASGKILVSYPELISQEYLDLYTDAAAAEIERYIEVAIATASPVYATRTIAVDAGAIVISATGTNAVISYPEIYSDYAAQFVTYLNTSYPEILQYVELSQSNDLLIGTYAVEITDQQTLDLYADALADEITAVLATVPAPVAPAEETPAAEEEIAEEPVAEIVAPITPVSEVKKDKGYDLTISVGTGLAAVETWSAGSFDKEITAQFGVDFENIGNWFDVRIQAGLIADNTKAIREMVFGDFFGWGDFTWRAYLSVLVGANWHNDSNMIYGAVGLRGDMVIGGTYKDKSEASFGQNMLVGITGLVGYRHNFNPYYGLGFEIDYTHRMWNLSTGSYIGNQNVGDFGFRAYFAFTF